MTSFLWILFLYGVLPGDLRPTPQEIALAGDRVFDIRQDIPIVLADDATESEVAWLNPFIESVGLRLPVLRASEVEAGAPGIYIGEPERHASFANRKVKRLFSGMKAPGPQGYRLAITPRIVVVAGADLAGTFYGVQTLTQLAGGTRRLPCLTIRDEPDMAYRGLFIEGPVTRDRLLELAAQKCNLIVFASDEFYDLTGEKAQRWKRIFDEARKLHMEPVPVLRTLSDAGLLLEKDPAAAEGRAAEDRLVLAGYDWQPLSKRNVLDTESSPIRVSVSGHRCTPILDYIICPGDTRNVPWLISRIPGGSIPDGATVDVTYSYVPPNTGACCPYAPETRALLREVLEDLSSTLRPRIIHIAHDTPERLNQDSRCLEQKATNVAVFTRSVNLLNEITKEFDPEVQLMLWTDAFNPYQDAAVYGLAGAEQLLPEDVILGHRVAASTPDLIQTLTDSLAWCANSGRDVVGAASGDMARVYQWTRALHRAGDAARGLIYVGGATPPGEDNASFRLCMDKSWSVTTPIKAWPEFFSGYFNTLLWEPAYPEILSVLVAHLNRQTLANRSPREERKSFEAVLKNLRKRLPESKVVSGDEEGLYSNLLEFLELEEAFSRRRDRTALEQLVALVESQAALDPDTDKTRGQRIIDTIKGKGLFVPSTILFREFVLPFRPLQIPADHALLEIPATPRYTDTEHRSEALYDFLASVGLVFRVDFDTVGTAEVLVEQSDDGAEFKQPGKWVSSERGGVRGPAVMETPSDGRFLKISALAPAGRSVLRSLRVFALKAPPALVCARTPTKPVLDGVLDDGAWKQAEKAQGFVRVGELVFAEAATTVRLCRSHDTLFVAANMREPRIKTMVAGQTRRDAPLWEEESFEVRLGTGDGGLFRYIVNPLGTRFDSYAGDASFDGDWQAHTRNNNSGWTAEMAIPFADLGMNPAAGAAWKMDLIRNRCNVRKVRSAWAVGHGGQGDPGAMGRVAFN